MIHVHDWADYSEDSRQGAWCPDCREHRAVSDYDDEIRSALGILAAEDYMHEALR